jgi:hypothetical protein
MTTTTLFKLNEGDLFLLPGTPGYESTIYEKKRQGWYERNRESATERDNLGPWHAPKDFIVEQITIEHAYALRALAAPSVGTIDASAWRDNTPAYGPPRFSRLSGKANFYGVDFHITAIAVQGGYDDAGREQTAIDPDSEEDLEHVFAINGAGPCAPVKIPGFHFDYVLVIYPFAD